MSQFGLKQADDIAIFEWAKASEFAITTSDRDFVVLAKRLGAPPKVIHLERCDYPLQVIEDLLRRSAVRRTEFAKGNRAGLLVFQLPAANYHERES